MTHSIPPVAYIATECRECRAVIYIVGGKSFCDFEKKPITHCPTCGAKLHLPKGLEFDSEQGSGDSGFCIFMLLVFLAAAIVYFGGLLVTA